MFIQNINKSHEDSNNLKTGHTRFYFKWFTSTHVAIECTLSLYKTPTQMFLRGLWMFVIIKPKGLIHDVE
jgi:hypothetical protein